MFKKAISDAEEVAADIKEKAQTEAEAEASRIITQAELKIQEIEGRAEIAAQRKAGEIISEAHRKAEIIEVDARQRALLFLAMASDELTEEIGEEYERAYSKFYASLQKLIADRKDVEKELKDRAAKLGESKRFRLLRSEAALLDISRSVASPIEEPTSTEESPKPEDTTDKKVEETTEPEEKVDGPIELEGEDAIPEATAEPQRELPERRFPEKGSRKGKDKSVSPILDNKELYAGEVEFAIDPQVELQLLSKLYDYLMTLPEMRVLYTQGSWEAGTTITVAIEQPIPLMKLISEIPGVAVTAEILEENNPAKRRLSLLPGMEDKEVEIIKLVLNEA